MASTNAWMVVPGPLTSPVGLAEVMRILRLGPPRFRPFALPGPLRLLRLLMRFQLLRSDVNVVGKRRAGRGIYLRRTPEMRPRARLSCQAFSALELTWSPYHAQTTSP